ncbi:hypothetical protein [Thomasclavelia cocleata]|uniref:hypothetical protein n=1 Tax=Thomasclavelia cocleata TaxID=69824 RepID=UPI0025581285|nr:hypothetical protein [Thomasclavelia cocleata]
MKISIKQLEFPSSIKDKILKLKDISKLHIDFIAGKYIHFENTNLSIHEAHQIIISNNDIYSVLINYENNPTLYDKSTMQNVTIDTIKFLILKMLEK